MKRIAFSFALACLLVRSVPAETNFVRVDAPSLPNAYWVDDAVSCGGLPDGDQGFAALAKMGVKTVISVDGQMPDVDGAARHGLAYVHLPHGYDTVPPRRILELAKAIADLPGPVYVHCHHGKHRSPAATAAACVAIGRMDHGAANRLLVTAGTGAQYVGLYRSVAEAKRVDARALKMLAVEFVPIAPVPELAASMVQVDHLLDILKEAGGNDAHAAVLLREQFTEMLRSSDVTARGHKFTTAMQHSLRLAEALEASIHRATGDAKILSALNRVETDCKACHQSHRDSK